MYPRLPQCQPLFPTNTHNDPFGRKSAVDWTVRPKHHRGRRSDHFLGQIGPAGQAIVGTDTESAIFYRNAAAEAIYVHTRPIAAVWLLSEGPAMFGSGES